MIITFLFRLCTIVGICKIDNFKESILHSSDLNSFSTKTAYRNSKLTPLKESTNYLNKCNLVQINTIFRHGTRFPSVKDMDKIESVIKKISKSHGRSILPLPLQNWKMPFCKSKDKELASVGYEEMMILGNKFRAKLTDVLNSNDIMKQIKVFSSSLARSKYSAATFLRSFLNETKSLKDIVKGITENDHYLRFFDNCPHYANSVLKNKATKIEYARYKNGPEIKRVIKDIQQKWKLTDIVLTPDDVRALYVMCGYEIATNLSSFMRPHECPLSPAGDGLVVCPLNHQFASKETSPLCMLLERDHFPILEYLYDIKHYWVKAYGKEINWLQACGLMSPLLDQIMTAARGHQAALRASGSSNNPSFQQFLNKQAYNRATFWFGHAETVLPVVALLGLFNQTTPMSAKSFPKRLSLINDSQQRFSTFRTSNIIPFSGNVGLELYHCSHLSQDDLSGYRVQVKVNEKAVAWPMANGYSHISIELLMKHLKICQADKYDHNAICVRGLSSNQLHETHKRSDEL